jgi:HSP20 family protein
MTLTRWNPFGEMLSLRQAMDRLLEESFIRPGRLWDGEDAGGLELDVMEKDDAFVVKASLPGVKPEDVNITVENGVLTISGEMREEQEPGEGRYYRRERRFGRFSRWVALPSEVNIDACDAGFEHGVLTIRLPKSAQARPRQIAVRSTTGTQSAKRPAIKGEETATATGTQPETGEPAARR